MREVPMLFSGPMVRAILEGRKTVTRRLIKGIALDWLRPDGFTPEFVAMPENGLCPYGFAGDRLVCYSCGHDQTTEWHRVAPHPGLSKRRLHGGVGREYLQSDEVRGIRTEGPSRMVSAGGANPERQGLCDGQPLPRECTRHEDDSSSRVHGVSRDAERLVSSGETSRRGPAEQSTVKPGMGNTGRKLAGPEVTREDLSEAEILSGGKGTHSLGDSVGAVEPEERFPCSGCGTILDPRDLRRGSLLWVRETHYRYGHWEPVPGARTKTGRMKWRFVADSDAVLFDPPAEPIRLGRHHRDPATPAWHKRLGRFMPRSFARLGLEVVSVRAERLQEITTEDVYAEGVGHGRVSPLLEFEELWDAINGKRASWESNPWVWRIEFAKLEGDQPTQETQPTTMEAAS